MLLPRLQQEDTRRRQAAAAARKRSFTCGVYSRREWDGGVLTKPRLSGLLPLPLNAGFLLPSPTPSPALARCPSCLGVVGRNPGPAVTA